jgi:hypothetical protein
MCAGHPSVKAFIKNFQITTEHQNNVDNTIR